MATAVVSLPTVLPFPQPTNITPPVTNDGVDIMYEVEQLLGQHKVAIKTRDAIEKAQQLADWLDQESDREHDLRKTKQYLASLTKICKLYCVVPTSYLIFDDELTKLGNRAFNERSNVWAGTYKKRGQGSEKDPEFVTVKILSQSTMGDEETKGRLCSEAVICNRMRHSNILRFIGFTSSNELAVVFPWMENGNIMDYLKENDDANPLELLREAATGLEYLHGIGLVHGSLQGRQILITDDGRACLSNSGHASISHEQGESKFETQQVAVDSGKTRFSPPEYCTGQSASTYNTKEGDVYSMGMTIYEVLTCKIPFAECNTFTVVVEITNGKRPGKPNFDATRGYTEELWELTTACWHQDPKQRPTVDEVRRSLGTAASKWRCRIQESSATTDVNSDRSAHQGR